MNAGMNRNLKAASVSSAILECQRQIAHWTHKLESLKAEHSRACKILRVADDPHTEFSVEDGDHKDKEMVVAALQHDALFFGCFYYKRHSFDSDKMAPELHENPDVLLAFVKSMEDQHKKPNDFGYDYFFIPIPKKVRRNKHFMLQICKIQGNHYVQASKKLKNDPELALVAYTNAFDSSAGALQLPKALLGNLSFVLQLVSADRFYDDFVDDAVPLLTLEEQRTLHLPWRREPAE